MKKYAGTIGLLHMIALYCLIVFSQSSSGTWSKVLSQGHSGKDGSHITLAATILFCHTAETESIVKGLNNLTSSFQNFMVSFSTCSRAAAINFVNRLTIYFHFSESIKVGLQKTVIIFPFHSFW